MANEAIQPIREELDRELTGYVHPANDLRACVGYRSLIVLIAGWAGVASRVAYRVCAEVENPGPSWTAAELMSFVEDSAAGDAPVTVVKRARANWAIAPIGQHRPAIAHLLIDRGPSLAFTDSDLKKVCVAASAMTGAIFEAEMHSARDMLIRERMITQDLSERVIEAGESQGWQESAHRELQSTFDSITEQKQELEEANRWNEAAHAELQNAFDELKVANNAKTRFLATVSHELKTPLTSISAFTDILKRNSSGNLGARELKHLDVVRRNVHRLNLLITDLLDLSRIDAGTLVLELDDFLLSDLIRDMSAMFDPILSRRNQRLEVEDGTESFWLTGDRNRLEQMITNLVTNASKFSPEGAPITLRAVVTAQKLELTVSDLGAGIPEESQERIFDAFYRVDNEQTRKVPGTGVGLYITASIVRLHGGEISVESRSGHGTTFRAILPGVIDGPSDQHMMREAARLLALQDHRSRLEVSHREAA